MPAQLYEASVLTCDLAEEGFETSDLGTTFLVYHGGYEVEFFTPSRKTRSVIALGCKDMRAIAENEVVAVRPLSATG